MEKREHVQRALEWIEARLLAKGGETRGETGGEKKGEDESAREALASSTELATGLGLTHNDAVGIVKSLEMAGKLRTAPRSVRFWSLTAEGARYAVEGSPEFQVLAKLSENGDVPLKATDLRADAALAVGLNVVLKNKWATSTNGCIALNAETTIPGTDATQQILQLFLQGVESATPESSAMPEEKLVSKVTVQSTHSTALSGLGPMTEKEMVNTLETLAKRKLVAKSMMTVFDISATENFNTKIEEQVTDLTREMLLNKSWKDANLKPYNFNAAGRPPPSGSIHPLVQTLNMFRNILIQMGFEEMPTQRWVESSFWNFDALFQPQTHPVRDAHDTFFLQSPAAHPEPKQTTKAESQANTNNRENESEAQTGSEELPRGGEIERTYFERVKAMHEAGDKDSLGWQCSWEPREACKLLMRTHTTAISSQMLKRMGDDYRRTGVFTPRSFFSIDRVFRNETLDATHLAEFHQVEGVVASEDASLAKLMGIIQTFFEKVGIKQLKFKPAYNPYTEPSAEIFGYHPQLKKWTEIGNSGVFRPEMLRPMGLPDNVVVLGWGLSLERPTMIANNVKDIRELFGPRAKLSVF